MNEIEPVKENLDAIRKRASGGQEYWMARDLQAPLGYQRWEDFAGVIARARMACESTGQDPDNHIRQTPRKVSIGSGAERERSDYYVSRFGAYLIAMNGSSKLPQIAAAQNYFAVQTRKQEIAEQFGVDISKRLELRNRVKDANIHLRDAAHESGVQKWGLFHDAGYRGLYEMGLSEIKTRKGLSEKEELLDRAGRAELAANEFRITQTEQVLIRDGIRGDENAREVHRQVGAKVRQTIKELGGTMPEDLPAEPSIKQIGKQTKKQRALAEETKEKDSD